MNILKKIANASIVFVFIYMFSYCLWIFVKPYVFTPLILQNNIELELDFENTDHGIFDVFYDRTVQTNKLSFTFTDKGIKKLLTVSAPYAKSKNIYFNFGDKGNIVKIDKFAINGENISLDKLYKSISKQNFTVGKKSTFESVYVVSKGLEHPYLLDFDDKIICLNKAKIKELNDSELFISYSLLASILLIFLLFILILNKFLKVNIIHNSVYFLLQILVIIFLMHSSCLIVGLKYIFGIEEETNYLLNFIKFEFNLVPLIIWIFLSAILFVCFKNFFLKFVFAIIPICFILILGLDNFVSTTFGTRFLFKGSTGFIVDFKTAIPFFMHYVGTTNGFIAVVSLLLYIFTIIKFWSKPLAKVYIVSIYSVITFISIIFAFITLPYSNFDIYFANVFQANHITTRSLGDYHREVSADYIYRRNLDYDWQEKVGLNKKQNVILIFVESLSCDLTRMCGDNSKPELTPKLKDYARNNLFFDNYYSDTYSTSMAVLTVIKSIPVFPQKKVMEYGSNRFIKNLLGENDLVAAFAKGGYLTSFFSSTDLVFNMDKNLAFTNFDQIFDSNNSGYKSEDKKYAFNSVPDELLFKRIIDYLDKNVDKKLFIMTKTASSHVPFNSPWGSDDFDNSFLYTDQAIDNFIKDLEKRDYFKDGIVVITGDHQPWGYAEGGNKNSIFSRYHVPLIIIDKEHKNVVDHTMFSHSSLGVYLQSLMLEKYKQNKFNSDPIHSIDQSLIMAYEFDKQIFAIVKQDSKETRIKFDGDNTQFMNKIFDDDFEYDVLGFLASCSL